MNKKIILMSLGVFLVLALLVGGGIYAYSNFFSKQGLTPEQALEKAEKTLAEIKNMEAEYDLDMKLKMPEYGSFAINMNLGGEIKMDLEDFAVAGNINVDIPMLASMGGESKITLEMMIIGSKLYTQDPTTKDWTYIDYNNYKTEDAPDFEDILDPESDFYKKMYEEIGIDPEDMETNELELKYVDEVEYNNENVYSYKAKIDTDEMVDEIKDLIEKSIESQEELSIIEDYEYDFNINKYDIIVLVSKDGKPLQMKFDMAMDMSFDDGQSNKFEFEIDTVTFTIDMKSINEGVDIDAPKNAKKNTLMEDVRNT